MHHTVNQYGTELKPPKTSPHPAACLCTNIFPHPRVKMSLPYRKTPLNSSQHPRVLFCFVTHPSLRRTIVHGYSPTPRMPPPAPPPNLNFP